MMNIDKFSWLNFQYSIRTEQFQRMLAVHRKSSYGYEIEKVALFQAMFVAESFNRAPFDSKYANQSCSTAFKFRLAAISFLPSTRKKLPSPTYEHANFYCWNLFECFYDNGCEWNWIFTFCNINNVFISTQSNGLFSGLRGNAFTGILRKNF